MKFCANFKREMRMLCGLRHNYLAHSMAYVCARSNDYVVVVMEVQQYGSLHDLLHNETLDIDDDMAVEILHDVAMGMEYLHSQKPDAVLHKYLSSTNVLLDRNLNAKVCDVGYPRVGKTVAKNLARVRQDKFHQLNAQITAPCNQLEESWVTPACAYMSPELLMSGQQATASDVYAFGVLIYEVMARKEPFSDQDVMLVDILCEVVEGEVQLLTSQL